MMSDGCSGAPAAHRATISGRMWLILCVEATWRHTCNKASQRPKCSSRQLTCGTRGRQITCESRLARARFERAVSPALQPRSLQQSACGGKAAIWTSTCHEQQEAALGQRLAGVDSSGAGRGALVAAHPAAAVGAVQSAAFTARVLKTLSEY